MYTRGLEVTTTTIRFRTHLAAVTVAIKLANMYKANADRQIYVDPRETFK